MLEDLDSLRPQRSPLGCKFGQMLKTLDDSDRQILVDAMDDQTKWSTHALHTALRQKGLEVGYQTMYRHRKGVCSCLDANA